MKNQSQSKTRSIGTCLVIAGLLLLLVFSVGFLSFGSKSPADYTVNDETRQQAIQNAQAAERQARSTINNPLNELIAYYQGIGYTDAVQPFLELREALASGAPVTDQLNGRIQGIVSVDGVNFTMKAADLQKPTEKDEPPKPTVVKIVAPIVKGDTSHEINLIGLRVEDALEQLEPFITIHIHKLHTLQVENLNLK